MFPDDDMHCAVETCRSSESVFSVNNFRLIYDTQLVHLLVCNTQLLSNCLLSTGPVLCGMSYVYQK